MKKFAVAIFGPTGVGKTALSLELAEYTGEIISVDSRQVYKYMDIGTAKPSLSERFRVKHYLIDVITPDVVYTSGEFKRNSEILIDQIISNEKIPFLVGGTGLYFNSLMNGMFEIPKIDPEIKKHLIEKWKIKGQERFYSILTRVDPSYASKLHRNDGQRTLRALEVYLGTKIKFSEYLNSENLKKDIDFIKIGLNINRDVLYERINRRVDAMLKDGFIDEVKKLVDMCYIESDPGIKGIGYKQIYLFLKNKISLNEAIDEIKQKTRNYAKRQLTWFNNTPDIKWFSPDDTDNIKIYLNKFLDKYEHEIK